MANRGKRNKQKKKGNPPGRRMVLVPAPNPPRQQRPRPRRVRRKNAGLGGVNKTHTQPFRMIVGPIKGNDSGTVKFGTSTNCDFLKYNLKAYQKYRIIKLRVEFKSDASMTDRGCIAYHIDTSLAKSPSDIVPMTTFGIRRDGNAVFNSAILGDQQWYESNKDQFNYLYKGSGDGNTAGRFIISGLVMVLNESL